jgi:hypothetical protein
MMKRGSETRHGRLFYRSGDRAGAPGVNNNRNTSPFCKGGFHRARALSERPLFTGSDSP